ncbi:FAD:protein FMN transferase [Gordonia sp. CPCC 205515]|uniref:FAD:protein FMN transferase n=1 Tax=Gordonia sp. CPCC 205515 TaxID=3140791 RepID=UPI003AF3E2C8
MNDWVFTALGTQWTITTPEPLRDKVTEAIRTELERIDVTWSRFRDDSMVAEMARRPGRYPISAADQPLIDWYRRLYEVTEGAVSPFVGQTLADAGYDAAYSLRPAATISVVPSWESVLAGHASALDVRSPVLIDVGAAGKGFAVDRVAGIVADHASEFIVDGSGDMVFSGCSDPVRVALEHPQDPTMAIGVVEMREGAICASASNRRAWADWHHIVDPRSSSPTWNVLATWVLAPTTMVADGLATALFFTSDSVLRERLGPPTDRFGHLTVTRDGHIEQTEIPGLEAFW